MQSRRFVYVEDLADGVALGLERRRHQPRLQPRQRRERDDQADRRDGPGADRQRRDRPHAGPPGRLRRQGRLAASARERSSAGRPPRRSPRACAATSSGAASRRKLTAEREAGAVIPGRRARRRGQAPPDPDHLGRHRRGPRPSGARGRPRVQGRGPGRAGLDRQRPARDGPDPHQDAARELGVHVPLGAVAVRLPVRAVHVLRADALAGASGC